MFIRKKTGDIFEVPLAPYIDLCAYCKYVSISKYFPEADYPDILIIYNYFSSVSLNNVGDIDTNNFLVNPIYIYGSSHIQKHWKRIGNLKTFKEDIKLPFEKIDLDYNGFRLEITNIKSVINWGAQNKYYSNSEPQKSSYQQVKHLEFFGISYLSIPLRIATEYFKLVGKDIRKELVLDEDDAFLAEIFMEVTPYSQIPVEFRGIPIPENKVKDIY